MIILKKISSNIILIILGCLFVLISLIIGYLNQFHNGRGMIFLLIGAPLLFIGIAFTPKIWVSLGYMIDMIIMFFNK